MADTAPTSQPSEILAELLQKTLIHISQQEYEQALQHSEQILEKDADNADGLQFRSLCNLELGNPEAAYEDFFRLANCGDLEREVDAKLYLGQMADGGENSLECFRSAFESILGLLERQQSDAGEQTTDLKRKATATLVSLAELYMTDLCFSPDAQQASFDYLNQALSIDSTDCDIHTNLASHSISSQQPAQQSLQHALNAYNCWKELPISDSMFPTTESMRSLAKVFVELGDLTNALDIAKTALAVDDHDPEMWYIAGWILFLEGDGNVTPLDGIGSNNTPPRPKEVAWPESKFALESCAKIYLEVEYDDQPLLEHVTELLSTLKSSNIPTKPFGDADEDEEEDEGEEWVSDDQDEEDGDMQVDNLPLRFFLCIVLTISTRTSKSTCTAHSLAQFLHLFYGESLDLFENKLSNSIALIDC
ncbi:hypothetical protein E3P81_01203 [Wallemia ichthyophaga]|nr:hypothetical protein E3P97_01204 [Wallemia ichthyophaga]TIB34363.1 hypothetical protein E3P85_00953 [Wallemia ichthyophaga]TIB48771.1 hypothetical protein E3P82_01202 [Wallemia ichthyophaga]TIB52739.1 hypothetical protein E3P81_01203 [Wallemia ichthyophaga]TIB55530.1 hypothetical protein E3P80_01203 [Wallemia ichthyophaga]